MTGRPRLVELVGADPSTGGLPGIPAGSPNYDATSAGTLNVPSGMKTVAILAHSTGGGSVQIGGGAVIPLPANSSFFDGATNYLGPLAIVFSGTDLAYVSWAAP